jgi:hypothetical protein
MVRDNFESMRDKLLQRMDERHRDLAQSPIGMRQRHYAAVLEKEKYRKLALPAISARVGLADVNEGRHASRVAMEDAKRPEVERRLRDGKSYEQIANAIGWSKTKVADAVKRWGLTSLRSRKKRSGQ